MSKVTDKLIKSFETDFDDHLFGLEEKQYRKIELEQQIQQRIETYEKAKEFLYNIAELIDKKNGTNEYKLKVSEAIGENAVDIAKKRLQKEKEEEEQEGEEYRKIMRLKMKNGPQVKKKSSKRARRARRARKARKI